MNRCAGTSVRTRPPQDTLRIASGLFSAYGITRVIEATGDDVLGVPVWFSERPAGLVSTLHSGKGLTSLDARVGAAMEAIECSVAEADAGISVAETWSIGDLMRQFVPALEIEQFAPIFGASITPHRRVLADTCNDVRTGRVYRLPSELLHMPAPRPLEGGSLFGWSSNGLASGNSLNEATLHALLEVLERDCVAMDLARPSSMRVDAKSLPPTIAQWVTDWARSGVETKVRRLENDFSLPCFEACIFEPDTFPSRAAYGWGLHPDREVAVTRAVTEAAQSRLHAARLSSADRRPVNVLPQSHGACRSEQAIDFADVPHVPSQDLDSTLRRLLDELAAYGLPWVLRRQMNVHRSGAAQSELFVVKVVVPGCESAIGSDIRIGRRLADRLLASPR